MINKIFVNEYLLYKENDSLMLNSKKVARSNIFNVSIECNDCHSLINLKHLTKKHITDSFYCGSCRTQGEKNPFYGKKHSEKTLKHLSSTKKGMYDGEKNPFYGKKHSEETKKIISEKIIPLVQKENNPFYGKTHSKITRKILSIKSKEFLKNRSFEEKQIFHEKIKKGVIKFQNENPEYTKEIRSRAARESVLSQKRFKMNKIEKIVFDKLLEIDSSFEYSVIFNFKQFDFGSKKYRILIEVHGDYWHGNPKIYKKEELNDIQKKKKIQDEEKYNLAIKHNFKIFYIWEEEINNGDYINIINKIKEELSNANI